MKNSIKTLVIHPKDPTTEFLSNIYSDKDWTIINYNTSNSFLKEQIKNHDRIIMLGHGTNNGLLGFNRFIINSRLVYLLREKECICIWCNADAFVKKYGLKGFYSGMIISEYDEAIENNITTTNEYINISNIHFASAIKNSIDCDNMLEKVKNLYRSNVSILDEDTKRAIYFFNLNRLYITE